tara:strand:+ start:1270 stop:1854 length:585 start_codon:yes stop_codon:yes gene_type:complete
MNLDYKIIGIAGNAGSGKDTLGENFEKILADQGIKAQRLSFAFELRKSLDEFLIKETGISAFTKDKNEKNLIRPLLVCWGTDIMRKLNDNIWIEKIEPSLLNDHVNIITDLRFPNELKWIKENNGFSLLIKRDGINPANEYEKLHNENMAQDVDLEFEIGNFDDQKLIQLTANEILNSLINQKTYNIWKATCHS